MAFDVNDPKDKQILDDAVAKAVEEATGGLSAKNKELLAKLAKAKSGGEENADIERLERELEEARGKLQKSERDAKDAIKNFEAANKQLTSEKGFSQRLLIDNGLTSELAKAGVTDPVLMKAAKSMLAGQITIKEDGENRSAVIGDKSITDFITEWSGGDEGKRFISAPNNSGGGSKPGSGGQGGAKPSITRAQFETMPAGDRHAHFSAGGTITD